MQKSEYEDMYKSEELMWWYSGLRDILHYSIQKYGKKNPQILDAGCGTGKNLQFLQFMKYQVYGIDISEDALKLCRRRKVKNVQIGSITQIPFKNESFDILYSMDVLGNLTSEQQKKAINEFFRVLKTGGIIILQTAAFEWLRSQHDDIINLKKRFTKKNLNELIKPYPHQTLKSTYRMFLLFPFIAAIKVIKKIAKKITHKSITDQKLPIPPLNWLLMHIQLFENKLGRIISFPWGSSVFVIIKKEG